MKTLTAFAIAGLLLAAIFITGFFLWDWIQMYIFAPISEMPPIYATGFILGIVLVLYTRRMAMKIARIKSHSKLLPEKAKIYNQLIPLLQKMEEEEVLTSTVDQEVYQTLKAKISILASHRVIEELFEWEEERSDLESPHPSLEPVLVAIRKDLELPSRRLGQHYFSDLLVSEKSKKEFIES